MASHRLVQSAAHSATRMLSHAQPFSKDIRVVAESAGSCWPTRCDISDQLQHLFVGLFLKLFMVAVFFLTDCVQHADLLSINLAATFLLMHTFSVICTLREKIAGQQQHQQQQQQQQQQQTGMITFTVLRIAPFPFTLCCAQHNSLVDIFPVLILAQTLASTLAAVLRIAPLSNCSSAH